MKAQTSKSRVSGALLGGAVGDAIGLPVEFLSIDQIQQRFGPNGVLGTDPVVEKASFSDDTQMTLWTAEGLIRAQQRQRIEGMPWDPVGVVNGSYLRWFSTQKSGVVPAGSDTEAEPVRSGWMIEEPGLRVRRAPGNTCLSALRVGGMGTREDPINDSKGCGGVMRVAPVGLIGLDDEAAYQLGCDISALTHGHPAGYVAGGALALVVNRLAEGDELRSAVETAITKVEQEGSEARICVDKLSQAVALAESETPSYRVVERIGQGWVAEEALAIAVYCALVTSTFQESILLAVNHSGDSDSTGSIAGQILGAIHGLDVVPEDWLAVLGLRSVVERVAGDLYNAFYEDRVLDTQDYPTW